MLLAGHERENFAFNRGWTILDAVNKVHVEQVKPRINLVADKNCWLLNKSLNLAILLGYNDSVASGVFNFSNHDSALSAMVLVEGYQLVKWVLANYIRVEHKEKTTCIVRPQNALGKLDWASGA